MIFFRDKVYDIKAFRATMKPDEISNAPLGPKKDGKEGSKDISTVFDTSP